MPISFNRIDKKNMEILFTKSVSVSTPNLVLRFISPQNLPKKTAISFITPKNVSKKANKRNLLRRRGYDILKKGLVEIPSPVMGVVVFGPKSYLFFGGRKNKKNNPYQNLLKEVASLFEKYNSK